MRIASLIARYLAGMIFLVMGLNGFLNFIPLPPPPGIAGQFMGALYVSHYVWVIFAFQVIGGLLLLINRYVPFGGGDIGAGDRQHPHFPRLDGSQRPAGGPFRGDIVGGNFHRGAACLLRSVPVALAAAGLTAEERKKHVKR